jgi:hypothetical protein
MPDQKIKNTSVMKTNLASTLRVAALAATLFLLPAIASAKDAAPADRAAQLLAACGSIPMSAVGPYVEVGTFQIQVSVKLGQPSAKLPDGTWLYQGYAVEDSQATGTLVVRFAQGRVTSLSLASPVMVAALRAAPRKTGDRVLVAAQSSR